MANPTSTTYLEDKIEELRAENDLLLEGLDRLAQEVKTVESDKKRLRSIINLSPDPDGVDYTSPEVWIRRYRGWRDRALTSAPTKEDKNDK